MSNATNLVSTLYNSGNGSFFESSQEKYDVSTVKTTDFASATHNHDSSYDAINSASTVQGNLTSHAGLTTTAHGGIVASNDSRLTDARTPTTHSHAESDVTNLVTDLAGKASTTHNHDSSYDALGSASTVQGNLNTHAGLTTTAHGGIVASNDSRLTDARTPLTHSHAESDVTNLTTDLGNKVDKNTSITSATKTKITYDAKGLVTSGADATTSDIADSTDKRYCTDAQKVIISNTTGTNSGDETTSTIKTKLGYASTITDGYLTSTDWNTFNGKAASTVAVNLSTHAGLTTTAHGGIVASNDSRLTDSRTPTAHASTHGTGQADAITIAESQVTNLTTDLGNKVDKNTSITGATKTKITYDTKGLVTSGADATTSDIADSTDKRYCTDAQKVIISNTTGTNSGDETTSTIKTKLGYASTNTSGYLTSTDWNTFNGKAAGNHNHSGVYEPVITAGTTSQYWRGDKSWQTLDKSTVGLGNLTNDVQVKAITSTANAIPTFSGTTGQLKDNPYCTIDGSGVIATTTDMQATRFLMVNESSVATPRLANGPSSQTLIYPGKSAGAIHVRSYAGLDNAIFYDSGTAYFKGNLGIDTASPIAKLQIGAATNTYANISTAARIGVSNTGARAYNLTLQNTGTEAVGNSAAISFALASNWSSTAIIESIATNATTSASDLAFSTYTGAALTEKMRITGTGLVGVGITPICPLDVVVPTGSTLGFRLNSTNGYGWYQSNENTLNFNYGQNADTPGYINYVGYNCGTTQFRDLYICDGKSHTFASFDGSTQQVKIGDNGLPSATLHVARGSTSNNGTCQFNGTSTNSHFNYSTNEDTYIRGGKSTSNVYINDTRSGHVHTGNNLYLDNGALVVSANHAYIYGDASQGIIFLGSFGLMAEVKTSHVNFGSGQGYQFWCGKTTADIYNGTMGFSIDASGNIWTIGQCSALSFYDRTPYPETTSLAYDAVKSVERLPAGRYKKNDKTMQVNHDKTHDFIKGKDGNSRDLSALVSCQNDVIKDLIHRIEILENK